MTTKWSRLLAITGMIMMVILLLAACEKPVKVTETPVKSSVTPATPTSQPTQAWTSANLLPIIKAASQLEELVPVNEMKVVSTREEGDYKYVEEQHNVIENRESVLYLGQNDDVLYPGAIIQGRQVYQFVYSPVIVARTPITLSLPLEGVPSTGDSIKITVDDPSRLSNVRQGINTLLKSAILPGTRVPAKFDYVSEQVISSAEKNLVLGVSAAYAGASLKYDFDWKSEENKNKIISIYKQVYYTVDMDLPGAPYDLFHPSLGVAGLAAALPAGSMPMYVSSVSYGWMAVLFIETDFSKDQMDMALDVAYDPAGDLEAKMNFGYSAKNVFQNSKIQIIVYGGSTSGITSDTLKGYSGLLELIQGSKNFGTESPAVPLSFRLRHLANNQIAKIALTEEYTVTKAVRLREYAKISVDHFACTMDSDESGILDMDAFGFWVKVYQGNNAILDQQIVSWSTGSNVQIKSGTDWYPDKIASTVVMMDMKRFDPAAYKIVLTAEARDIVYTLVSIWRDLANGSISISGDQMYSKPSNSFTISYPGKMTFQVFYTIQPATYEDCLTYPGCKKQLDQWSVTPTPTP